MALTDTQQTMDAYFRDLLNRGDYSRHYSDDVVVEVRGTDQRYRGREAAKNWVEGIHAVAEIKGRNTFMGETHAVAEAELVRKDGISVPYSVIYDVAASKIHRTAALLHWPRSAVAADTLAARVAQALVDAGATTKPAAVVASILSAHAEGTALNRIASDMGIHHKTVSKIIDAAEDHRQRLRVAM